MKRFLPFLLLTLAIVGAYAPSVRNGFVWDDTALILRDPFIRSWRLVPEGFQHFLFTDATASDFYRPIQRLAYTVEYGAFGFRPAAFHITNILCHLAAALALVFFARELLRLCGVDGRTRSLVAFLGATIWAIHPVQSSAVTYISGRADPLAAAFGFAGLFLGLVSLRSTGVQKWSLTSGAAILFLLSALSKEAGLTFLALWMTILLTQRKASVRTGAVVVLFVVVSYLSLRLPAEHIAPPAPRPMPVLVRPILFARALAEYTGLIVLPLNLRMERDIETHPSGFGNASMSGAAWRELQTLAGVLLLAAFVASLLRARRRDRAVFLLLLLALTSYLPVSGLVQLNATVAEHWLYQPSAFLFLALILAGARWLQSIEQTKAQTRSLVVAALVLWISFLGGRTFLRTFDWRDQRTFLERTIASGGDSARMLINLACFEMNERRFDAARKHLQTALQKEPDQPLAIINLAAVALKQNAFAATHELLTRATQMPPVAAQAHEMLAVLEHRETGRTNLQRLRLATRTGPPEWLIEKRYVNLLAETGATDAAMNELRHCLETQWYRAESWQLLGELAAKSGRESEARAALSRAQSYDIHLGERARAF